MMDELSKLSPRLLEVLHLTSKGMLEKEIARALDVELKTVKTHRTKIRKVIGRDAYRRAVYRNAE